MVSSVLLIVDAQSGPMPQTRFVLSKALKQGICPIVVINKIDRPNCDPLRALEKTHELFIELGATDDSLVCSWPPSHRGRNRSMGDHGAQTCADEVARKRFSDPSC